MLKGIHLLLTYTCTCQRDHCFLHCGPDTTGTFTLEQLRAVFQEIRKIGTIDMVYFEGGQPFRYYPLMLEDLRMVRTLRTPDLADFNPRPISRPSEGSCLDTPFRSR